MMDLKKYEWSRENMSIIVVEKRDKRLKEYDIWYAGFEKNWIIEEKDVHCHVETPFVTSS